MMRIEVTRDKRKADLEKELLRLIPKLKELQVHRAILFGSLARNKISIGSDIDLIVVCPTQKRFLERWEEIYQYLQPTLAVDVLVYTPEELEEMKQWSSLVKQAIKEGKELV